MSKKIMENERRRQQIIKKRKVKRQKIIIRNVMVIGILIIMIGVIKSTFDGGKKKSQSYNQESGKSQSITASAHIEANQQKLSSDAEGEILVEQEVLNQGNLILVNDSHPIRDYSDEDMVAIGDYLKNICQVKSTEIKLQKEVVEALVRMLKDFNEIAGVHDLTIISGYRDFETQEALHYESMLKEEEGENFVARPDRSEHHTGLAIDFGLCYDNGLSGDYDGSGVYNWINENCYKYGFIVRYDETKKDITGISHEPWHFRYVGKVHAQIIKELDLCLEEYIEFLKGYQYGTNPGQGIIEETQNYSIYYVASEGRLTHIPTPISKDYSISGNNQDGFIVTVDLEN